jgi:enamine deaminase RidA (YjgF/YER057c/UK114 family)
MDDWSDFDAEYRTILRPPYPTRTTVGAELHGFLVELSLIAAVR